MKTQQMKKLLKKKIDEHQCNSVLCKKCHVAIPVGQAKSHCCSFSLQKTTKRYANRLFVFDRYFEDMKIK